MARYVIAFDSTHAALAVSKALTDAKEHTLTIPLPRAISAGCGIALAFEADEPASVLHVVRSSGVASRGVLYLEEDREIFTLIEYL